jgi:hypothetical protein
VCLIESLLPEWSALSERMVADPFHIASPPDLIRMKEIAASDLKASTDLQDFEFLKRM